jgi:hypothetical protein
MALSRISPHLLVEHHFFLVIYRYFLYYTAIFGITPRAAISCYTTLYLDFTAIFGITPQFLVEHRFPL